MDVKIQTVRFDANKSIVDFVNTKMSKLKKFAEDAISAEVILKEDKNNERGDKVATIKLTMPGDELIADIRSTTFEASIDEGVEVLKRQLERYKERYNKR